MNNTDWRESDWDEVRDLIIEFARNHPLDKGPNLDYELYIEVYTDEGLFRQYDDGDWFINKVVLERM
jgi:hypothetical protein